MKINFHENRIYGIKVCLERFKNQKVISSDPVRTTFVLNLVRLKWKQINLLLI